MHPNLANMMKKIRIVSPSGSLDAALIDHAAARLQQEGYEVVIGSHAKGAVGRFAGTEDERLADLQEALNDADCQFILCGRGGYGLMQIVDRIAVPEHCPVVIGFSDITALHCLMGHHGKPSIHGVMCKHLSEGRESANQLLHLMQEKAIRYELPHHPLNREGRCKGVLRGGNLSLIYGLQATPFDCPVQPGDILFIEDVGEHPYAIDRMMQNLRLSGMLSRLGGLIVGQFSDYEEDNRMPYTVYEGIRKMVEAYDYPVLFDFPAGHVEQNWPLVMNAQCELDITNNASFFAQKYTF